MSDPTPPGSARCRMDGHRGEGHALLVADRHLGAIRLVDPSFGLRLAFENRDRDVIECDALEYAFGARIFAGLAVIQDRHLNCGGVAEYLILEACKIGVEV